MMVERQRAWLGLLGHPASPPTAWVLSNALACQIRAGGGDGRPNKLGNSPGKCTPRARGEAKLPAIIDWIDHRCAPCQPKNKRRNMRRLFGFLWASVLNNN